MRYLSQTPRREYPAGVRIVHNFPPGPADDHGRDRPLGLDGFRAWVTDEPEWAGKRCYCGWLGREHYGTRYLDEGGEWRSKAEALATEGGTR
jgi:hypothetical protein